MGEGGCFDLFSFSHNYATNSLYDFKSTVTSMRSRARCACVSVCCIICAGLGLRANFVRASSKMRGHVTANLNSYRLHYITHKNIPVILLVNTTSRDIKYYAYIPDI